MRRLFALLLLCGIPAWAAPDVTSVSGELADGEQIVIVGTGFGSGPSIAVFDDFNDGVQGADRLTCMTCPDSGVVGTWDGYGDSGACGDPVGPVYDGTGQKRGAMSMWYASGRTSSCSSKGRRGLLTTINDSQVFYSWWIYPELCMPGSPASSNGACDNEPPECKNLGANWKMSWLMGPGKGVTPTKSNRYTVTSDCGYNTRSGSNGDPSYYGGGLIGQSKKWIYMEVWVNVYGSSGYGDMHWAYILESGNYYKAINRTNVNLTASSDWTNSQWYQLDTWGQSSRATAWVDDFYVATGPNARARVILTDTSTLDAATNIANCTQGATGDSWDSESITCTVRSGSFSASDSVYILVFDGSGNSDSYGPLTIGAGDPACGDSIDNDGDGEIDYPNDPGCTSAEDTSEYGTAACDDGVDNDSDGQIDYANDPGCSSLSDVDEQSTVDCDDGVDDDSDGETDYPDDPGCTSSLDASELGTAACDDAVDNDSDGETDYSDDPGCSSLSDESEYGTVECDDGVDNDSDGEVDYSDDPGCSSLSDASEYGVACDDGIDNDSDGGTDYPSDTGCTSLSDASEFHATADCDDGIDNDSDGDIDCANDAGCESCTDETEAGAAQCEDAVDNDGDGDTDYPSDSGCANAEDDDERECGDDYMDDNEGCDGTDLNSEDCESRGFSGGGTLACEVDCSTFDTSLCIPEFLIDGVTIR